MIAPSRDYREMQKISFEPIGNRTIRFSYADYFDRNQLEYDTYQGDFDLSNFRRGIRELRLSGMCSIRGYFGCSIEITRLKDHFYLRFNSPTKGTSFPIEAASIRDLFATRSKKRAA